MEFIKNKEKFLHNANEVINNAGEPKELAQTIEDLIFSHIQLMCEQKECLHPEDWGFIYKAREIRNLFNSIETI